MQVNFCQQKVPGSQFVDPLKSIFQLLDLKAFTEVITSLPPPGKMMRGFLFFLGDGGWCCVAQTLSEWNCFLLFLVCVFCKEQPG